MSFVQLPVHHVALLCGEQTPLIFLLVILNLAIVMVLFRFIKGDVIVLFERQKNNKHLIQYYCDKFQIFNCLYLDC